MNTEHAQDPAWPRRDLVRRAAGLAPVLLVVAVVLLQAVVLLAKARTLWFFGDDFDFLLNRSITRDPVDALLRPHNEHWSTLPVIAFRVLFTIFGVDSYLPYAALPIGAHVVVFLVGYLVLRRAGTTPWPAALATVVVSFLAAGAGAENTLWDFQIGFLGACAFGMLALWLAHDARLLPTVGSVVCLVLALMTSGPALVMLAWVCLYALFRDGVRRAVLIGIVPLAVYAVWYLAFGRGHSGAPPVDLAIAPAGFVNGLAHVWGSALLLDAAGPVALAVLVAAVVLPRGVAPWFALAYAGLGALLTAYALFSVTRSGLGIEATTASRYVYFGLVFCLPAVGGALQLLADRLVYRAWARPAGWLAVAAVAAALGLVQVHTYAQGRHDLVERAQQNLAAAERVLTGGEAVLTEMPDSLYDPDISNAMLTKGVLRGKVPKVHVPREAELSARESLQVAVSGASSGLPSFDRVSWIGFGGVAADERPLTQCETHAAAPSGSRVDLLVGRAGGQAEVTSTTGQVQTALAERGASGPIRNAGVPAGSRVYLSSTAAGATLRLFVLSGKVTVCPPGA